jgi:hypothetical protein
MAGRILPFMKSHMKIFLPALGLLLLAGCVAPDYDYVRSDYYSPSGGYYDGGYYEGGYYDGAGYYGGCLNCGSVSIGVGYGYPGYGYGGYGYPYHHGHHDHDDHGDHGDHDWDDHHHSTGGHDRAQQAPVTHRQHTSSDGQRREPAINR